MQIATQDLFRLIQEKTDRMFLMRVSYLEIYQEEIRDLLNPENTNMQASGCVVGGCCCGCACRLLVCGVESLAPVIKEEGVREHPQKENPPSKCFFFFFSVLLYFCGVATRVAK